MPCIDAFVAKITAGGPGVVPPTNLRATPGEVTPGGTLTVTWAGLPTTTTRDELRLYTLGSNAGPGDHLAGWFTGGTISRMGTIALPTALVFGAYELRVLSPDPMFPAGYMRVVVRSPGAP